MEYKLIDAVDRKTHQKTQKKYIGKTGTIVESIPVLIFMASEGDGTGFITSEVIDETHNRSKYIVKTVNSTYTFENLEEWEAPAEA